MAENNDNDDFIEDPDDIHNSELFWNLKELIENNIPSVPSDLIKSLNLWHTSLGGAFREKLTEPKIEEHHKAFHICRERDNHIRMLQTILDELQKENLKMIGCIRNSYAPPYNPESLVDAWRYDHKDHERFAPTFKDNDEYLEKAKDAYDYWMNIFNRVTKDTGAIKRSIGQHNSGIYGYFNFYIPGILGRFELVFPQNMLTDYGHDDKFDDMKISISYSEPGKYTICYSCMDFDKICSSYTIEDLNKKFLEILNKNKETHLLKNKQDFTEKLKRDFENSIEKYKKNPDKMRSDEKETIEQVLKEMDQYKCELAETPYYKKCYEYMITTVTKNTEA